MKKVIVSVLLYTGKLLESVKTSNESLQEVYRNCSKIVKLPNWCRVVNLEKKLSCLASSTSWRQITDYLSLTYVNAQSVLRVGCTIQKSLIQQEIKHLVLLQKDCSISKCHDQVAYARKDITFNQVRMSGFWVLGLKMIVWSVISKFVICKRLRGRFWQPEMAVLSDTEWVKKLPLRFETLICFLRPFVVTNCCEEMKQYGALYTCLSRRVIHIGVLTH